MKTISCLLLCFGSLGVTSCGPLDDPGQAATDDDDKEPKGQRKYIGQIASVHAAESFVLIRRSPGVSVPAGTILMSSGPEGRLANLRVSGEKLGELLAADVQSGNPMVGDSVVEALLTGPETEEEIPQLFTPPSP